VTTDNDERTIIDSATYTVRRSIQISAPVEQVWRTITEPELISTWFTQSAALDGDAVGSTGVFTFSSTNSIPVRIVEIDEPRVIAYRWSNDDAAAIKAGGVRPTTIDDAHSLVMRFTLEPSLDGTILTVTETGFETTDDPEFNMGEHVRGWNQILDQLLARLAPTA
jgi:uncharacterized protein YndB with AHSA1/START domain